MLFAAGLSAGWNRDFGVAVHILVPQLEATVRYHLKNAGVTTPHLDDDGLEEHISLPALLDKEAEKVFGADAVYELKSVLVARFGSNLRHDVAHGLVDDTITASVTAVHAWWVIFKLFMVPFWNQMFAAAAAAAWAQEDVTPEAPGS